MMSSFLRLPMLLTLFVTCLITLSSAYRPVQFVKHTGDNGRADQAFSVTNYYNATTGRSDMYVRMHAYRYKSSNLGWAALAFGYQMKGALMFQIYGDPALPGSPMTLSWRTATGHHPPRPISEMGDFYSGPTPDVYVYKSQFEEYKGQYVNPAYGTPSHIGVAEFVVFGYERWTGVSVKNDTTNQEFLWSSNFKQDFGGDFGFDRHTDMHQFGLGFGFVGVDLLNAVVPEPIFGPIDEEGGHKGVNEIGAPFDVTPEELAAGAAYIATHPSLTSATLTIATTAPATTTAVATIPPAATTEAGETTPIVTAAPEDATIPQPTNSADELSKVEQPASTWRNINLRSLMWHLHGLLMVIPFLGLYPLGTYMIRAPRPTAFNSHWTIQALGSLLVGISTAIGYINSHSISITHQYFGFFIVFLLATQLFLGWRHHVVYLRIKRPTWMSLVHVWLGRIVLPAGMVNIILGLLLRHYGWFTIGITVVVSALEFVFLIFILGRARSRSTGNIGLTSKDDGSSRPLNATEDEEYFQLGGEDDDLDSDDDDEAAATKQQAKREQNARLAKLDRV